MDSGSDTCLLRSGHKPDEKETYQITFSMACGPVDSPKMFSIFLLLFNDAYELEGKLLWVRMHRQVG